MLGCKFWKKEFTKEYEFLDLGLQEVPPASFCIQAQSKIRFRMFSKFPNPNAFRWVFLAFLPLVQMSLSFFHLLKNFIYGVILRLIDKFIEFGGNALVYFELRLIVKFSSCDNLFDVP